MVQEVASSSSSSSINCKQHQFYAPKAAKGALSYFKNDLKKRSRAKNNEPGIEGEEEEESANEPSCKRQND
jgi:hypothetical protein